MKILHLLKLELEISGGIELKSDFQLLHENIITIGFIMIILLIVIIILLFLNYKEIKKMNRKEE